MVVFDRAALSFVVWARLIAMVLASCSSNAPNFAAEP